MSELTIAEFLLARITEDEAELDELAPGEYDDSAGPNGLGWAEVGAISDVLMTSHKRAKAECESKRRIVELHDGWPVLVERAPRFQARDGEGDDIVLRMSLDMAWTIEREYRQRFGSEPPTAPMMKALAAVYADHPDFDPAWGRQS